MLALNKTDKLILGSAFFVLVVFSYFMYDDSLLFKRNQHELVTIGEITLAKNDVRKKTELDYTWSPGNNKETVFLNDSVFTGENSEAHVRLKDGSLVTIKANSLITFAVDKNQLTLNLKFGDLEGELKESQIAVKNGNETIYVKNESKNKTLSKLKAKKDKFQDLKLNVIKGSATLSTNNQTQQLTEAKPISIKSSGEITQLAPNSIDIPIKSNTTALTPPPVEQKMIPPPTPEMSISLLTPNGAQVIKTDPSEAIPLDWKGTGPIQKYQLEIAKDVEFKNLVFTELTTQNRSLIKQNLAAGKYFWRVTGFSQNEEIKKSSEIQQFNLGLTPTPIIAEPKNFDIFKTKVSIKETDEIQPTKAIKIQWSKKPDFVEFEWQLSSDSQFKKIVQTESTKAIELKTQELPIGKYWTRVRAKTDKLRTTLWSPTVQFSIEFDIKKLAAAPTTPQLKEKSVSLKKTVRSRREIASIEPPRFSWNKAERAQNYKVQISKSQNFDKYEEHKLEELEFEWEKYRNGKYFYRLIAVGPTGLQSEPSETGQLEVDVSSESLIAPKLIEPYANSSLFFQQIEDAYIVLEWKKTMLTQKYQLEIYRDPQFKNKLIDITTTENRFALKDKVEAGSYYWRVKSIADSVEYNSGWSETRSFTIVTQKNNKFAE